MLYSSHPGSMLMAPLPGVKYKLDAKRFRATRGWKTVVPRERPRTSEALHRRFRLGVPFVGRVEISHQGVVVLSLDGESRHHGSVFRWYTKDGSAGALCEYRGKECEQLGREIRGRMQLVQPSPRGSERTAHSLCEHIAQSPTTGQPR